eukprot:gene16571-16752_t
MELASGLTGLLNGARAERLIGAAFLLDLIVSGVPQIFRNETWFEHLYLVQDSLLFLVSAFVIYRSSKVWPLLVLANYVIQLALDGLWIANPAIQTSVMLSIGISAGTIARLALLFGAWRNKSPRNSW